MTSAGSGHPDNVNGSQSVVAVEVEVGNITMGSDTDSLNRKSMKGKLVISKVAAGAYIVITLLIILAVGLLVGLVARPQATVCEVVTTEATTTSTAGVVTSTTAPQTTQEPTGPWDNIRLPSDLVPINYVVDLVPDLVPDAAGKNWFTGTSEVFMQVDVATSHIYIHSNKLNYTTVEPRDPTGAPLPLNGDWWLHSGYQYLIVPLASELVVGTTVSLYTEFEGELSDDLGGLYRSKYTDTAGNQVTIATTQMQPTDARKAFPCFDEPALKATFNISLSHRAPDFALSNMPVAGNVTSPDGWTKTTFERTEKMSSYLLAFVVCAFDFVENNTVSTIQTRIYARPDQVAQGNADYASSITPKILQHFENYFNVSYPLPKSDQIAVPDFAAGAMENWGLVIYRETALLYNPQINSASNQQRVAAVVAHELAHQWFGNLISPLWWDELWLNEGFASYVEYLGTDYVEPTWRMNDQFIVSDLQRALRVDGLTTSRPIVAENVQTPDEINALFDTISYSKGACIIRMINEFVGEKAFKLGLERYLKTFAYGPVNHDQLFEYWDEAQKEIGETESPPGGFINDMNTWMLQMGFPTINMKRDDPTGTRVTVSQERFLLDSTADPSEPTSPYGYVWAVPLWWQTKSSVNKTLAWISASDAPSAMDFTVGEYFLGNYEGFGYYRVNYDDDNWRLIIQQLITDFSVIDVRTRGQLLNDAFNLARAGKLSYDIALNLTEFLQYDYDYITWESALDELSYFNLVLGRSKVYGPYSEYLAYLVTNVYNNLTWVDDGSHLEQYQRINAIDTACSYGVPGCVENATMQFMDWQITGTNSITPNLRTTVYCHTLANTGSDEWDFVWQQYLAESNSQEKAKLQYALTCTQTPWIVRRFLDYVLDETYVRSQDASSILEDLCYNEYARDITWDYIRQNWGNIYNIYGTTFFSFSGIISSCTSHFSTEFELQELEEFKQDNLEQLGSGLRATDQAIESTKTNIQWRTDNEENVYTWLTNKMTEINGIP